MGIPKNIIEMNGKRYDAVTGKMLNSDSTKSSDIQNSGNNVDGFVRRKSPKRAHSASPKAQVVHSKLQHSKALMRRGVKKPEKTNTQTSVQPRIAPLPVIQEPVAVPTDPSRFARAKKISKSALVSRFSTKSQTTKIVPSAPVKVTDLVQKSKKPSHAEHNKSKLQQSLNQAVANAHSHEQPRPKAPRKRRRLSERLHISQRSLNISLFILAFVMVGGFISYQNIPNFSMRLAAARSGVHGSLPGYKPSGFSLKGPIYYQPGQITLAYKSNSDDRKFNVIQRNSSWNNETLLEKYVSASRRSYQTYQDQGRTIFIYDGNNASWIDDGVWYEVQAASSLSQDQLIKLANSL